MNGLSQVDSVRRQARFVHAECDWIESRWWYRLFRGFRKSPAKRHATSVVEFGDYPPATLVTDQASAAVLVSLNCLCDVSEKTVVGKLAVEYDVDLEVNCLSALEIAGPGRQLMVDVRPDDTGEFSTYLPVPPACRSLTVRFQRTKTRSTVFLERVESSTALPEIVERQESVSPVKSRIAVYADVDPNVVDGSSVWLASIVQVLVQLPDVGVDVFLKKPLVRTTVLKDLIGNPAVSISHPAKGSMEIAALNAWMAGRDQDRQYDLIVVRGYRAVRFLSQYDWTRDRLAPYITDLPDIEDQNTVDLRNIFKVSRWLLCQTEDVENFYLSVDPAVESKLKRLPPMIPDESEAAEEGLNNSALRIAYAGKFAPDWGLQDMLNVFAELRRRDPAVELHVFGDKFQGPSAFRTDIAARFRSDPGVTWYGAVSRSEVISRLAQMDVAWGWRDPQLEESTRELSTKVLEYGSASLPVVLYPNGINVELLGRDYGLFAATPDEALDCLSKVLQDDSTLEAAVGTLRDVVEPFRYSSVARSLTGLINRRGTADVAA